jgi:hypothetical protein
VSFMAFSYLVTKRLSSLFFAGERGRNRTRDQNFGYPPRYFSDKARISAALTGFEGFSLTTSASTTVRVENPRRREVFWEDHGLVGAARRTAVFGTGA